MNSRYYEIFGGIVEEGVLTGGHRGDVALLRTKQKMQLTPLIIADSSLLKPWDPLITVGHPTSMNRTGPWGNGCRLILGEKLLYPGRHKPTIYPHKEERAAAPLSIYRENWLGK